MRHIRFLAAAFILTTVLWGAAPALSKGPKDDAELTALTRSLFSLISDPLEVEVVISAPLYVRWTPIDPYSSNEGALMFFSLEGRGGGNGHTLYAAYFQKLSMQNYIEEELREKKGEWNTFRFVDFVRIGGRGWRGVEWEQAKLTGKSAVIPTTPWVQDDPGCCPSGTGTIRIQLDKSGRLQVTDIPVRPAQ